MSNKKVTKRVLKIVLKTIPLGVLIYFLPKIMTFYILCGLYDVGRNRPVNLRVIEKYFLSKGILLWVLSPLNILMDLLTLPYLNKGIYALSDLPQTHQKEIEQLITVVTSKDVDQNLRTQAEGFKRGMIFFKWYLKNIENNYNLAEFHKDYKYVITIGISVFNKKVSTSAHFGPLRASLRFLYNINVVEGKNAWIEVGNKKHYWSEDPVFIFDDTLLHQSFNETDDLRYCLFVDVLRPTYLHWFMRKIAVILNFTMSSVNKIFYKNWKKIS